MIGRRLVAFAVVLGIATAVVSTAIVVSARGGRSAPPRPRGDATSLVAGIPQHGLVLGDPRAPVLLVEFADAQCPYCRQFAIQTWPEIVRRYVRTGKVRVELRMLQFLGPDSTRAAKALEAAGLQNRMWDAAARFYGLQREENSGYVTDAFLRQVLAGVHGLDVDRAMADRTDPRVTAQIGAAGTLASRYAVTSTPTLLMGTGDTDLRPVAKETPSPEQLGAYLDAELARHR